VRVSDTAKLGVASVWLLLAAALAGCQVSTDGRPVRAPDAAPPTQPGFPTSSPTVNAGPPTGLPTISAAPPAAGAPPPTGSLPPTAEGYVYIETKSGQTRCQLSTDEVDCEAQFTNSPMQDGMHANGVSVTARGAIRWVVGNLGDIPVVTLDYRTYQTLGWTISATTDGTRFTKAGSGHGMFVSVGNVETF
jgi:hypothetical protein